MTTLIMFLLRYLLSLVLISTGQFDEVVEEAVRRLTPLYELAASSSPKKFINLDMEEYKDLDMTIEVFTKILDQPHLKDLEAGIVPSGIPARYSRRNAAVAGMGSRTCC